MDITTNGGGTQGLATGDSRVSVGGPLWGGKSFSEGKFVKILANGWASLSTRRNLYLQHLF